MTENNNNGMDSKQDALDRLDKVIEEFKDVAAKRGAITPDQQHEYSQRLIESMTEALKDGPWDNSVFLRAIGTKLKSVREYFRENFSRTTTLLDSELTPAQLAARVGKHAITEDEVEVYISLYSGSGRDIKAWEHLITTMGKQIVTRPVLSSEEEVRELIRSKINQVNEAYISVRIHKNNVVQPVGGIAQKDALGHTLLTIRESAIRVPQIQKFYHISGVYEFEGRHLVRKGSADFMVK